MRKLQDPMKIYEPVIQKVDWGLIVRECLFRYLTRRTNVIRLNHLIRFGNRSQRLTYCHSCKCRAREEFVLFSLVTFFAGNLLLTVYLECGNELPVAKYKDLLAKYFLG